MLASLTVMLMLGTASAYGGTSCLEMAQSGNSYGGDSCANNECRISGPTRRRASRVGATFCLGGVFKNIWYKTTTTEALCNATPTANIAGSLPADYTSYGADEAKQKKQKTGQCWVESTTANSGDGESQKYTCEGVADTKPPVKKYYRGLTCATGNLTRNESQWMRKINNMPAPCFCNSDQGMYNVASDCYSCDVSENQCSTSEMCTKATYAKCSWSGSACSCKTGAHRKASVCFGGALHDTFFEASTYAACKSMKAGTYIKFPTKTGPQSRGSCKKQSSSKYVCPVGGSCKSYNYKSYKEMDCTGVADGQPPLKRYFNQTECVGVLTTEKAYVWAQENCACMRPTEQIQSECSSCSGVECSTKDSCARSKEGTCSWNAAASSNKCSCASKVFKSRKHCWDGQPADIIYENVDMSKCTSGDTASVTLAKPIDISKENEFRDCQKAYNSAKGTHYKELSCTGVPNGQPAKKAYYNDAKCVNLNSTEANTRMGDEKCRCELYNGCAKGTTFEKYWCDGAGGKTIAVEYSDGLCTKPTGVNRTLSSVTDALNPGKCGAWPPINLKPNFDSNIILECKANQHPSYHVWPRTNRDSLTPSCGASPYTTAQNTGSITECACKNEYFFNAIALKQNVQIEGDLTMTVSDVSAAVKDVSFKKIVKTSIAETAGVSPANVVDLTLVAARRLHGPNGAAAPRKLASGGVKASYVIIVPKAQEMIVKKAVTTATVATINSVIATKSQGAGITFTATITAKSAPASAPATIAVSTTGAIAKLGIDANGQVNEGSANDASTRTVSAATLGVITVVAAVSHGS